MKNSSEGQHALRQKSQKLSGKVDANDYKNAPACQVPLEQIDDSSDISSAAEQVARIVAERRINSLRREENRQKRRQHTFETISLSSKSRSRSPIVCREETDASLQALRPRPFESQQSSSQIWGGGGGQSASSQMADSAGEGPQQLDEGNGGGSVVIAVQSDEHEQETEADDCRVSGQSSGRLVGHLVSPASFARRRSVYEAATERAGRSSGDNLSLDAILAEIQIADRALGPIARELDEFVQLPNKSAADGEQHDGQQTTSFSLVKESLTRSASSASLPSLFATASCSRSSSSPQVSTQSVPVEPLGAKSHELDAEQRRHVEKFGFEIAWLNFSYSIEPRAFEDPSWGKVNKLFHKERRNILRGLSGGLRSGQMVALMGPSGAGKTCLLESISGLRRTGLGGRICLHGRKRVQLVIVPQHDDFMQQFSVEETIIYGSRLKNPPTTNHSQVASTVIEQLGLQTCRHNNIQRCSGGQRKRVAIAQELVSRPNILVLDEPTSGLDSSCCYQTMSVLRAVLDKSVSTEEPMAIVSTIHQPSAKVFEMFDQVYLLGKTGCMAYSGPPDEVVPILREITGLECPQYCNPSDFMIELVAYDYGTEPVERMIEFERKKAAEFKHDFERRAGMRSAGTPAARDGGGCGNGDTLHVPKSDQQLLLQRLKAADISSGGSINYRDKSVVELRKAIGSNSRSFPFLWHVWVHLHRSFFQAVRDPILNNMRVTIHLFFGCLLVLLYGVESGKARGCPPILGFPPEITDPNHEQMVDLSDNIGYLFMCIMLITYVSLMSTVLTFPIDIKTIGREFKNGWYDTPAYFLGKNLADLPFIIGYPVVYSLITWFLTSQGDGQLWRYFSFTGLIILNALNSQSFGYILGATFMNSVTAATFLGPVVTIPWYLFTGFTKRVHRFAEPFKIASKFLFTRYVFEGVLDVVYGHQRCNCSEFLEKYHELRYEEANRLGQLISIETLSSLDYYDGLDAAGTNSSQHLLAGPSSAPTTSLSKQNFLEQTFDAAASVFSDSDERLNLASLVDSNVKASSRFSFGLDFEPTCPANYETFVVQDFRLGERNFEKAFVVVLLMFLVNRLFTYLVVAWKIRTRQL